MAGPHSPIASLYPFWPGFCQYPISSTCSCQTLFYFYQMVQSGLQKQCQVHWVTGKLHEELYLQIFTLKLGG